jgi:PAS domain S-box-containing protein
MGGAGMALDNPNHPTEEAPADPSAVDHAAIAEALERERILLRGLVDNLPDNIFVKDAQGRYILDNAAHSHFVGRPSESILGRTVFDFFPREQAEHYAEDDRQVMQSGQALVGREEPIRSADGEQRWVSTTKAPLRDSSGAVIGLVCISRDVTARKRAELALEEKNRLLEEAVASERRAHDALKKAQAQMVQNEKLAALGQLVAGVAHEINNPLAFVVNNLAVLQRDAAELKELIETYQSAEKSLAASDPATSQRVAELTERMDLDYVLNNLPELFHRSRDGLRRIQDIVKDLREFARNEAVGDMQEGADVNAGIESTLNIARGRARKQKIELVADLAPLPRLSCRPAKINQVILNLVMNAIDACIDGGKVTVRTRPGENRDGITIEVIDTGTGMPEHIRSKIFDPFFTTKPQGQGTGLGLSISHGIVTDHGGTIEVESAVGHGSRFIIHLPCNNSPRESTDAPIEKPVTAG